MTAAEMTPGEDLLGDLDALFWEADPQTFQFSYVSRAAERLLGYPRGQWLTRPRFWAEMLHPDDRDAAVALCCAAVEDGRDHEFEYRAIAADGRVVWIRDIVRVTRDANKQASTLTGVMVDITAQKTTELALRKQNAYLQAIVEHTLDVITVVSRDGAVIFESPSIERVFGYDPRQRVGQSVFDSVHPADVSRVFATFERAFASNRPTMSSQFRYRHANGSWRTVEAVSRAFVDDSQQIVGIINSRDITERALLEDEARDAQKMEALSRCTGPIAHDFNNLVTTILGNADMAIGSELSVGVRPQLREIRQAAEIGASLARQLLLFSETRSAVTELIDVPETLHRLESVLRRLVGPNIRLKVAATAEPAEVRLAAGNLEQIVMNLVLNARDAMPTGGSIDVAITRPSATAPDGSPRDVVRLEVADTGCGMSRAVRARIFEPYFTTKAPGRGTGLGLSAVYGLVSDAGGTIDVDTEVGQGTRFFVHLPRVSR